MKIVIASGKGGTGKSMIASSLAILLSRKKRIILVDCDVDSPSLHIWLGIRSWEENYPIACSRKARIISQKELDERILKVCRFGAIKRGNGEYEINEIFCEGCGACEALFPSSIEIYEKTNAEIRITKTPWGFYLISAQLYPGESGSGKIVDEIKEIARKFDYEIMILDSPAGIGCPVISALKDSNFAFLVTEPTPTALADLERITKIVKHFGIEFEIILNKYDMNPEMAKKIERIYREKLICKIPFDRKVFSCLSRLKPAIFCSKEVKERVRDLMERIIQKIDEGR